MFLSARPHSSFLRLLLTYAFMLSTLTGFHTQNVTASAKDNQVTVASYESDRHDQFSHRHTIRWHRNRWTFQHFV